MSRFLLRVILAVILTWLLGGAAVSHAAVALPSHVASAYSYDLQETPAVLTAPASGRGPPTHLCRYTTYDPDGLRSLGVSWRPNGTTPRAGYDYHYTRQLVQTTRGSQVAERRGGDREADPADNQPLRVAANAGARLLKPSALADEVASATGGVVKANKGGYTVNIPHGSRGITVRVMERGGSRTNYYRVSVPGKEAYTATGRASTDANLTHIGIGESSLDDILSIVARIQGGG